MIIVPTIIVFWGIFIAIFGMGHVDSSQSRFFRRVYQGTLLILGIGLVVLVVRLLYILFAAM